MPGVGSGLCPGPCWGRGVHLGLAWGVGTPVMRGAWGASRERGGLERGSRPTCRRCGLWCAQREGEGVMRMGKKDEVRWDVPLEGTEAHAVSVVKKQMKKSGLTPNDAGVRKLVREVRKSSK